MLTDELAAAREELVELRCPQKSPLLMLKEPCITHKPAIYFPKRDILTHLRRSGSPKMASTLPFKISLTN